MLIHQSSCAANVKEDKDDEDDEDDDDDNAGDQIHEPAVPRKMMY